MLLKINVYKATVNFFYFQVNFGGFEKMGIINLHFMPVM